jgi:hypothetical protein
MYICIYQDLRDRRVAARLKGLSAADRTASSLHLQAQTLRVSLESCQAEMGGGETGIWCALRHGAHRLVPPTGQIAI